MFRSACRTNGLSELRSWTREILQRLWGCPSVRMRDSLNLIQRNDLGAEWIDHHDDLLLSFILLFRMVNLRDLPIVRDDVLWSFCLSLRMVWWNPHVHGICCHAYEILRWGWRQDPSLCRITTNGRPPWESSIGYLELTARLSVKKTQ